MKPEQKARLKKFFTETLPAISIFLGAPALIFINSLASADDRATQKALEEAQVEAEKAALIAKADCAFTYHDKDYRAAAAQLNPDWPEVRILGPAFVRAAGSDWQPTGLDAIVADFENETAAIQALAPALAVPACQP